MRTIAYVDGFNLYFGALRKTPHRWLDLQRLIEGVVNAPAAKTPMPTDLLSICVPPPKVDPDSRAPRFKESPSRVGRASRNYLEIEARNRSLGRAGEELVVRFEHERLWAAGKPRSVRWRTHSTDDDCPDGGAGRIQAGGRSQPPKTARLSSAGTPSQAAWVV